MATSGDAELLTQLGLGGNGKTYLNLAKEILEVSQEGSKRIKGAWWQNEDAKEKVKAKKQVYNALVSREHWGKKRQIK